MSDVVLSALADFQKSTSRVNALTDAAAEKLRRLEDYLESCSFGFDASIAIEDVPNEKLYFTYARLGKRFRFGVRKNHASEAVGWSECSRELKLRTISHLPVLMDALAKKIQKEVARAESAATSLENILSVLNVPEKPSPAASTAPVSRSAIAAATSPTVEDVLSSLYPQPRTVAEELLELVRSDRPTRTAAEELLDSLGSRTASEEALAILKESVSGNTLARLSNTDDLIRAIQGNIATDVLSSITGKGSK